MTTEDEDYRKTIEDVFINYNGTMLSDNYW